MRVEPDIILSDFSLPQFDGLSALELCQAARPDVPFIFLSGTIGEDRTLETLEKGAADYILKSYAKRLGAAVRRALKDAKDEASRKQLESQVHFLTHRDELRRIAGRWRKGWRGSRRGSAKCWICWSRAKPPR